MIPTSVRIFVCTQPLDMRRSFDGLAAAARQMLGEDPRSGALFVFTNRRSNRLKVLWWDKNGYCMLCKRLQQALFRLPSTSDPSDRSVIVDGHDHAFSDDDATEGSPSRHRLRASTRA